jgi:hypothetical protein
MVIWENQGPVDPFPEPGAYSLVAKNCWAHSSTAHQIKLSRGADFSMNSMRVEIMHVWNTPEGFISARMPFVMISVHFQ